MRKRIFPILLLVGLMAVAAWAAEDPMVGDWKLNPAKSKLTDEMKVTSLGSNKYSFDFGGDPETIVVDGTDQPGVLGTTLAVTAEGDDRWKVVRKKDGRVIITGIWTLSKDGRTLTDHFTAERPNGGTTSLDYVYERRGDGRQFAGDWVSTTEQVNSAYVMQVRAYEGDGLSFITPGGGGTKNVKFDGKDYANVGAIVDGLTSSVKRVNERTVEMTDKSKGKVLDTQEISVSDDGKTLTITVHAPERGDPDVLVFERQ
jgi:hypothetical protein